MNVQEVQAMKDACKGTFDLLGSAQEAIESWDVGGWGWDLRGNTARKIQDWVFLDLFEALKGSVSVQFFVGGNSLVLRTYPCQVLWDWMLLEPRVITLILDRWSCLWPPSPWVGTCHLDTCEFFGDLNRHGYPSWSQHSPWKYAIPKRKFIFKPPICRC